MSDDAGVKYIPGVKYKAYTWEGRLQVCIAVSDETGTEGLNDVRAQIADATKAAMLKILDNYRILHGCAHLVMDTAWDARMQPPSEPLFGDGF